MKTFFSKTGSIASQSHRNTCNTFTLNFRQDDEIDEPVHEKRTLRNGLYLFKFFM